MTEERISKLDLSKWQESQRQFVLALADVMANGGPERVQEHMDLTRRAPTGVYDDWYLDMPSVYSLIKYGEAGIQALMELGLEGNYCVPHVLVAVTLSDWDSVRETLRFTQAYLEDDAYERLLSIIEGFIKGRTLAHIAESALTSIVHAFLADPDQRHNLVWVLTSSEMGKRSNKSASGIDLILKAIASRLLKNYSLKPLILLG